MTGRLSKRLERPALCAAAEPEPLGVMMRNRCRGVALFRRLLALLTLLVSACVVNQNQPYPESWSPVPGRASEGCQDLDGVYADLGEPHKFPAVNPSLTFNLGWQGWSGTEDRKQGWRRAKRVTLSILDADSMEAVIWGANDDRIASHVLTRASGEFVCESGHATIRWHAYAAEDVVAARDDYTVELSRAGEYLVAHVHDRGIGVVGLVVPIGGKTSGWVRFERLSQGDLQPEVRGP